MLLQVRVLLGLFQIKALLEIIPNDGPTRVFLR